MANINAGANPDELDRLAATFSQAAGSVSAIQRSLNPQIMAAPWRGRNADQFRQRWSGEHRRAMAEAMNFLSTNADHLRTNAQDQRTASSARGTGALGAPRAGLLRAVGGALAGLGAGTIVERMVDVADIAQLVPGAAGFGAGIGLGLIDLLVDRDGYGGEYHLVESVMDGLGVVAAVAGLGGLIAIGIAGSAAAAPAAVIVVGGAMIAGGVIKGVDLFLGTSVGKTTMTATADFGRSAWKSTAGLLDSAWDAVF